MKKNRFWLLLLFSLPLLAQAQKTDSTRTLSTDLDTTITVVEAPVEEMETDEDDSQLPHQEKEREVFTPTWLSEKDSIQLRKIPEASKKTLKQDDAFWYVDHVFDKKKAKQTVNKDGRRPLVQHPAFQTILWIVVVAGFVTFIVIFLSSGNAGIFRRNTYIKDPEETSDTENIFAINYQQELEKAVNAGNYRLGVRLLFLRLLRNLSDRRIIDYTQDRTNLDYLMQLQPTRYYADFFRLARHYEYSWYGQFIVQPDKFSIIRQEFESFDRKLNEG